MFKFSWLKSNGLALALALTTTAVIPALVPQVAEAATKADINNDATAALNKLYAGNPTAKLIGGRAKAILIFPSIVKAGLVFGGSYGEGELLQNGGVADYYNSFSGSWGLQAGAQSYGYAVFLMSDSAVKYLHDSSGLEIGVGPTVVVVDEGVARNLSTSTLKDDAYAFIFDQKGLMAGVSIEGTKISKIKQ
ncbi:lipid-binding SYLF domain-containing protein [Asticcacaulis sp. 201]|uniref:lipid-binding SYLF domain-containing protein n=1 Tax=Asticcacaulis sp. 201 TaxID=3028787 RepID=UPI002916D647|nr:lipid-binding SYLF domain-containing protein [Asticcacaulis sp. 201]MDV6332729.1 lipid-binding SYLF domain-containing protein [Asticcacaulis sp. 201]